MYKAVSSSLSEWEASLIERYLGEQQTLDKQLAAEYQQLIETLDASMSDYLGVLDRAFAPDMEVALLGSVELALELGVAADEILDSDEKSSPTFSTSPMPQKREQACSGTTIHEGTCAVTIVLIDGPGARQPQEGGVE